MLSKLPTIRVKLAILVAACTIPSVLFSGLFVYSEHRQFRQHLVQTAIASTKSVASALDKDLRSIESALQTLSVSPFLQDQQLALFYETAIRALPFQNISNFVLIDDSGKQIINTLKPFGAALPAVNAAPPEILAITENKRTVVSNIFTGPVTGKPILAMGIPVLREGRVPYSLNVGIFPERLQRLLKSQELPPDWIAAIIDANGHIVARTHEMNRFIGKRAASALLEALRVNHDGTLELTTLDGVEVISAYQHSGYSNWSVAIGVPKSELFAELRSKVIQFIALSVMLTLSMLAFAWLFAVSQIIRPAEQLLLRMRALAKGEDTGPKLAGSNREFRTLEIGLEDMARQLAAQESEKNDLLQQLVTTLESINDGFILLDMSWRYKYINRKAELLLQINRQKFLNQDWRRNRPTEDLAFADAMIDRVLRNQSPINKTTFETRQEPSMVLELRMFRTGSGIAIYLIDLTQRKQIAQAQAAKEAAEAANQAKNSFLARTSHELRTPLNAIVGLTQVLLNDRVHAVNPQHCRSIQLIESSSLHLMALINDILDISRAEAGTLTLQMEPTSVIEVLEESIAIVKTDALAAGLNIRTKADAQQIYVTADPIRLRQTLINLLSNAIKYNKHQGSLLIECQSTADRVNISVIDSGIGLTQKQIEHLFEPFNRLGMEKTDIPGTGMGLVVTKYLIEKMGGELSVESTPGVGSKFSFYLKSCGAPTTINAPPSATPYRECNVLLVAVNQQSSQKWAALLAQRPQINLIYACTETQATDVLQTCALSIIAFQAGEDEATTLSEAVRQQACEKKPKLRMIDLPIISQDATEAHEQMASVLRQFDEALAQLQFEQDQ